MPRSWQIESAWSQVILMMMANIVLSTTDILSVRLGEKHTFVDRLDIRIPNCVMSESQRWGPSHGIGIVGQLGCT
ncbi:hypothetical protein BKA83DRAFT_4246686 [Pisolithus microcarpus]|nr:hypothetical protein BKA83DRAFT_4246686 [Pisolithus microcarpus]